ncbi:MAG: hypothetical protein QXJ72_05570 [Thermoproteota archaeon]
MTEKEYQIANMLFLIQETYRDLLEEEKLKKARKNLLKILFYFLSIIDLNEEARA